ncbi:MAG: dihydrolipoyl dehydrogenase [Elusimicrobia bacterium]|nr:dihydrolipoyl dehydrogenase [Elusimicrobiota bacterium]
MKKNIVIIGAGPGGEAAAKRAAKKGAQVTLVEKRDLGGLCLNRGCIPSKTLLEAGRLLKHVRAASSYMDGHEAARVRWEALQKKREAVVTSLRAALTQNLSRLGVRVVSGEARFADERTILVRSQNGEEKLAFDAAVVAAGSEPFFPEPFPSLKDEVLDSDKALELSHVPARLVIVGGGAIGCEFACLYHELGSRVTLVEKMPALLPGEDAAVVRVLRTSFEKRGIQVLTETTVESAARGADGWSCRLSNGTTVAADDLLVCVGRRPAFGGLELERANVRTEKGRVPVNEFMQTSQPRIYAVGDVNGISLLAHAASAQGDAAVDHILGENHPYSNGLVPRCLYTWPEVASVGEWVYSAEAKGTDVRAQRFFFQASAKAMADDETEGFLQVVSEKKEGGRVLGAQIVGPHATELIHIFSVAIQGGFSAEALRNVIFAHPTLSEGVREALSR